MSKLQQLFNLAATLPDEPEVDLSDVLIEELFRPMNIDHLTFDVVSLIPRLKYKLIYAKTTDSMKYGSVTHLYYLDDKPVFILDQHGRWLSNISIYYFCNNTLEELRKTLMSHATVKDLDMQDGPSLLTEDMLVDNWWGGRLTKVEGYPSIDKT